VIVELQVIVELIKFIMKFYNNISQQPTNVKNNQIIVSITILFLIFCSMGNISDVVDKIINIQSYAQSSTGTSQLSSLPDNTLLKYRNDTFCASNIIKGFEGPVTVRHCLKTIKVDNGDMNYNDSPVSKSTGKSVVLGTPKVGPATMVVFHFGKVKLIPAKITEVFGCSSMYQVVGSGYAQSGDSGGALYQEDKNGNKIAVGVLARIFTDYNEPFKVYEDNRSASKRGDSVYRDCKVAANRKKFN
jgi:hypothetical protein